MPRRRPRTLVAPVLLAVPLLLAACGGEATAGGDNPVPSAASISPASAELGVGPVVVTVDGQDFARNAVAYWNGQGRRTTHVGPARVTFELSAADLAVLGSHQVVVGNPAPGGGLSAALPFTVVQPDLTAPAITGLPARGGSAGRAGFPLAVDGVNFVPGATVLWDGAERPTTQLSTTRLVASLSAADLRSPRTVRVSVRTPGRPAPTNAVEFVVRTVRDPVIIAARTVAVPANDLIADPVRPLLYASVPSTGGQYGNSVVAIDPSTGAITRSAPVGSEPEHMAVSDDGQYLYVSLRGASSVQRVALASFTGDLRWALPTGIVEEMQVMPGAPGRVVLSAMTLGSSPRHAGVFAYEDGARLPAATPGHTGSNALALDGRTPDVIYGYNNETSEFGLRAMRVDAGGVRVVRTRTGLMDHYDARLVGAGGRLYTTTGAIIDPETMTRTGSLALTDGFGTVALHADVALGRVFYLVGTSLQAFDMNTMQPLGTVTAPAAVDAHPYAARLRLVRWGSDGLAYTDGTAVHLLRTTLSAP